MKIHEVLPAAVARLTANSTVAPFAPFIIQDGVTDNEATIDAALEARGACIAVFRPGGAEVDSAANNNRSLGKAALSVVLYDLPPVAHSPAGDELLYHVITALQAGGQFQFQGYTLFTFEKGGVACVADLTANVTFG